MHTRWALHEALETYTWRATLRTTSYLKVAPHLSGERYSHGDFGAAPDPDATGGDREGALGAGGDHPLPLTRPEGNTPRYSSTGFRVLGVHPAELLGSAMVDVMGLGDELLDDAPHLFREM